MKKVLLLFLMVFSVFALSACTDTETITDLENQVAELEADVTAAEAEVAALEADLATAEAALAAAEGDVTDLEAEVSSIQGQLTAARAELLIAEGKIVDFEAEVADLEAELLAAQLPVIPTDLSLADANFDEFLGRPDVQYVDLRNFDDKMNAGYVAGFEFIPFFDYLEYSDVLVRTDGDWTFDAADIVLQAQLENLFDADKEAIFLMCGSGTRAGFVLDALESIGYTNVINVGGISAYAGSAKVLGDGTFELNHPASGMYTPGTYFAVDPQTQYTTTIVVGAGGAIEDVVFDAMYHGTTKNTLDTAYTLASGVTWKAEAEELAAYIVANQGWGEIILDITDITGMNALTVPHHFIEIDHTGAVDAVAGVTIGAEGFVLSWNLAIAQAGGTPLAGVPTSEEWEAAHAPAYEYVDGVYFGMDEAHGYSAKVIVEDGFIVSVFFDALQAETEVVVTDPDGTPDSGDETYEAVVTEWTTKQVLGFDYGMVAFGGAAYEWFQHADMLADAIVDVQQWDPLWVIYDAGSHDKFDNKDIAEELCTQADVDAGTLDANGVACVLDAVKVAAYDADDYTIDSVGGVTIGIEGFKVAFDEAIAQAYKTLFISEYIEGSSSNKAIEIYNPNNFDIVMDGYKVCLYSNGATECGNNIVLDGVTIEANGVYVISNASANAEIAAESDVTSSITYYNGDDALALLLNDEVVDIIGLIGEDPASGTWPAGTAGATGEFTLVRNADVMTGVTVWDPTEWTEYAQDTTTYLGDHTVN